MERIELIYPWNNLPPIEEHTTFAIGYFDGVHLGHQEVLRKMKSVATESRSCHAVMTFHPHPKEVLGKQKNVSYVTPLNDKLNLLEKAGVERTYIVQFDLNFATLTPTEFVECVLIPLKVNSICVGFNFTFGSGGLGTVDTLREIVPPDIHVHIINPIRQNGDKVSSTLIRQLLFHGEVQRVTQLLGRPHTLKGLVVHGDGRGKTIGFPTANLELQEHYSIPGHGVYAVFVRNLDLHENMPKHGVMNIGVKPTFGNTGTTTLEVFIRDDEHDLYGNELEISFISKLRSEIKFNSKDELVKQINQDIQNAWHILEKY